LSGCSAKPSSSARHPSEWASKTLANAHPQLQAANRTVDVSIHDNLASEGFAGGHRSIDLFSY
jgi:hypothetical protein